MPISKGRSKHKQQKQVPLSGRRQQESAKSLRKKLKDLLLGWWGFSIALVGLVASLFAIWDAWVRSDPEIRAQSADPSSAFYFPFSVKNPSSVLEMKDVEWVCHIDELLLSSGSHFKDSVVSSGIRATIKPNETVNFRCSIDLNGPSVVLANMKLNVRFKSWFVQREYSMPIYWDARANPPRWIEGRVLK